MSSALLVQTKGFGQSVMEVQEGVNGLFQFTSGAETAAADPFFGDDSQTSVPPDSASLLKSV